MATMNGNVEELKAQGYQPCPGCGAYYNPADPNVKDWHCSNCGRLASGVETRFDYCPWCGARMDGDSDA